MTSRQNVVVVVHAIRLRNSILNPERLAAVDTNRRNLLFPWSNSSRRVIVVLGVPITKLGVFHLDR